MAVPQSVLHGFDMILASFSSWQQSDITKVVSDETSDHLLGFCSFPACRWQCCKELCCSLIHPLPLTYKPNHFHILEALHGDAVCSLCCFSWLTIISCRGRVDISSTTLPASKMHGEGKTSEEVQTPVTFVFVAFQPSSPRRSRWGKLNWTTLDNISPVTRVKTTRRKGDHFGETGNLLKLICCQQ